MGRTGAKGQRERKYTLGAPSASSAVICHCPSTGGLCMQARTLALHSGCKGGGASRPTWIHSGARCPRSFESPPLNPPPEAGKPREREEATLPSPSTGRVGWGPLLLIQNHTLSMSNRSTAVMAMAFAAVTMRSAPNAVPAARANSTVCPAMSQSSAIAIEG